MSHCKKSFLWFKFHNIAKTKKIDFQNAKCVVEMKMTQKKSIDYKIVKIVCVVDEIFETLLISLSQTSLIESFKKFKNKQKNSMHKIYYKFQIFARLCRWFFKKNVLKSFFNRDFQIEIIMNNAFFVFYYYVRKIFENHFFKHIRNERINFFIDDFFKNKTQIQFFDEKKNKFSIKIFKEEKLTMIAKLKCNNNFSFSLFWKNYVFAHVEKNRKIWKNWRHHRNFSK